MPKRKCWFNITLQHKYQFIKQRNENTDVTCEKCRTDFSFGHGGASEIKKHLKSEKHRLSDQAAASSTSILTFFERTDSPTSKDLDIAAAKCAWACHTMQHNYSFCSNDCSSHLIKQKFRCVRTKSQAIIVNLLSPMATDKLKEQFRETHSITLLTDASNHGSIKLFLVMIRYFLPYEGVKVKVLEFREQPGETSDIIVDYLKEVLSCNDLIGIGCRARIVHNEIKTAADCLPLDFECIIVKIYSFFYIYSVQVEALKEFCDSTDTEYHKLLGYSKTTWLALMSALESSKNVSTFEKLFSKHQQMPK
ncbi:hypothetical protein RN001_012065 [Aquatica leii]|uniref:Uncharacterized protein n=1 Tax=Aquatica leii TaxID=1421715 RepID=A0AAN7QEI0_9COLE|nr:hypothetical protein RN001_012065 [Aquatica leii]